MVRGNRLFTTAVAAQSEGIGMLHEIKDRHRLGIVAEPDLVVSNGVLNLVPDKVAAYTEIVRVLRPGGRIQIADICVDRPVPEGAKRDIDLWTG